MKKELTTQEALDKLVEIAAALDKNPSELASEMAKIVTTLAKKDDSDDSNDWDNVYDMLEDIKKHADANGGAIIQDDRPAQLKLGYRCTNTNKVWTIRISKLKHSVAPANTEVNASTREKIIQLAFQSLTGRENILKVINGK